MTHRSYLLTFVLCLLPVGVALGASGAYLARSGEFLTLEEIIEQQRADPGFCLYGTALHEDIFNHKYQGFLAVRPEAALIGSSRVITVRQSFFHTSFYNAGGGMDSVVYAGHLLDMLKTHRPGLLLWGIDYWWLRGDVTLYHRAKPPAESQRFTVAKLFRPFQWLAEGKITARGLFPGRKECNIGVQAWEKRNGFGPDGSYYWTSRVTGNEPWREPGFRAELRQFAAGKDEYVRADDTNEENMEELIRLIRSVQAQGVPLIVFFPPMAPSVYAEMERHPERLAYIRKITEALRDANIDFYDFHDPRVIGSPDCEFLDGTHGGEVTYARMFKAIHASLRDPTLKTAFETHLDVQALDDTIARNAGSFMVPNLEATRTPEVDFLRIGCAKT